MKRGLRQVAVAVLVCRAGVAATIAACIPPDYGQTTQPALVDAGPSGTLDAIGEPGPTMDGGATPGMDGGVTPGMDGGTITDDSGTTTNDGGTITNDGGTITNDGGTTTDDGGTTTDDGGTTTDDGGTGSGTDDPDGGNGGDDDGSATPSGVADPNVDLDSFYACNAGTAAGGLPLALVVAAGALRRRRRRRDPVNPRGCDPEP